MCEVQSESNEFACRCVAIDALWNIVVVLETTYYVLLEWVSVRFSYYCVCSQFFFKDGSTTFKFL